MKGLEPISKAEQRKIDIRDVAFRITDALVDEGLIPNRMDTNGDVQFDFQDIIVEVLNHKNTPTL